MSATCPGCAPDAALTPAAIDNRAGLSAIAYRVGVYGSFRQAMLDAIGDYPELANLMTRQGDDYSVTFIELWSAVLDVLTFYQERYANELFLRTAQQQSSLVRLARLLDYRPSPGVAAETSLAFTLDPGAVVQIPVGLQVQSVAAQGQPPQFFETIEAVSADARFNAQRIYPQPASGSPFSTGSNSWILDRIQGPTFMTAIAPNDPVVLFNGGGNDAPEEKKVASLTAKDDQVTLTFTQPIVGTNWNTGTSAYKFRRILRLFGYNAPSFFVQPGASTTAPGGIAWTPLKSAYTLAAAPTSLCLDSRYADLAAGTQLLIATPLSTQLVTVGQVGQTMATSATTTGTTPGAMSDTVTQIALASPWTYGGEDIRAIMIYELVGNPVSLWPYAYEGPITEATVYLPGVFTASGAATAIAVGRSVRQGAYLPGMTIGLNDLNVGRRVILVDASGVPIEATVQGAAQFDVSSPVIGSFGHLVVPLAVDTGYTLSLDPASAVLLGNVVRSSNGQTVSNEVLGSGDASQVLQDFTLQKQPLTYFPSTTPGGVTSSLQVSVNQLLWSEVPLLYGQSPAAQVFTTRTDESGKTLVQGGDGTHGAVFPTGNANITATYRVGTGVRGEVGASAITTLLSRIKGLTSVTNPIAAEGGADPETTATTRNNAPRTVRTFGRAVSLKDFEDLITASGEVAKAQADWIWDGFAPAVHLTVAGQEGAALDVSDLSTTLDNARDPNHRLLMDNYVPVPITVTATLWLNPTYPTAQVQAAAAQAVLDALSFDQLDLGQSIHLSQVYAVLQAVPGVVAADITNFGFLNTAPGFLASRGVTLLANGAVAPIQDFLRIFTARPDTLNPGQVLPAELACIQTPSQDVTVTLQGAS